MNPAPAADSPSPPLPTPQVIPLHEPLQSPAASTPTGTATRTQEKQSKEIKNNKHLLSFLTGDENETDFICNTCIAYSFLRKIIPIVKKNRVLYYIGGEKRYNEELVKN